MPYEAAEREALVAAMSEAMSAWGYGPVETPVVEEYRTLEAGVGGSLEGTAFRLFDSDGQLLALRPEMTVPIARLAATRLAPDSGAQRLRYAADVYREHASLRGQSRQFTQVGVELIGVDGPAADAEVVAVLVETVRASGLADFSVAIGTVAVLRALLANSGMPESWQACVLQAIHDRNLVELDRLTDDPGLAPEKARAISGVPRLRGDSAIDDCADLIEGWGCDDALQGFRETVALIEAAGVQDAVEVDFGVVRSFDYYTGIVFEVDAPGLGLAVGGGGRYDGVLEAMGQAAPAAGFAVALERLRIALSEQDIDVPVRGLDAVLGGSDAASVLKAAADLRGAGWRVRLDVEAAPADLASEADRWGTERILFAQGDTIMELDATGAEAGSLPRPLVLPRGDRGGDAR